MKKVVLSAAVCAMVFSANADVANESAVAEAVSESVFSSFYGGLGIGGSFLKSSIDGMKDMKTTNFMGSFVLGGGKVFGNRSYLGGELLINFMRNKKKFYEDYAPGANLQMKGFSPQVNVKLGYNMRKDVLGYGKMGCAWSKISFFDGKDNHSKNKTSFVLGVGAEKFLCPKISAEIEADYNFGFKTDDGGIGVSKIRANKGWSFRALAKCNVKH